MPSVLIVTKLSTLFPTLRSGWLNWTKKRVDDWTPRITVNEFYSIWRLVTSEIPQGSAQRPKYLTIIKHNSL